MLFKFKTYPSAKTQWTHFAINLALAFLVIAILLVMENTIFFKEKRNYLLDHIMYWHSDQAAETDDRLAIFNIDEATYRDWGSPLITPRDKLKTLIEKAAHHGANVIVVDLNLAWTSEGYIDSPNDTLSPADQALGEYLQTLNESEAENTPIVILTREYRLPLTAEGYQNRQAFLQKPPIFLDNYLTTAKNVFWAATFYQPDSDTVLRRWEIASLVCEPPQLTLVPSMQLLAALAQQHSQHQSRRQVATILQNYQQHLNQWANQFSCTDTEEKTLYHLCQQHACDQLNIDLPKTSDESHTIKLVDTHTSEKVVYRFAPPDNPQVNRQAWVDDYSAQAILAGEPVDVLKQIVLIGATHQNNSDKHLIPIRFKPVDGVYIVANAIDTLLRFGQFQPQSLRTKGLIAVSLAIITALIFTLFEAFIAFILTGIGLVILVGWSLEKMHYGIEIDLTLYLLAIQVVQFSTRALGFIQAIREKVLNNERRLS
jgi:CHASE2 domain-containing sensor protein